MGITSKDLCVIPTEGFFFSVIDFQFVIVMVDMCILSMNL